MQNRFLCVLLMIFCSAWPICAATKIRVSHSHGYGSCEGYISTNEQGIRYDDTIRSAAISHSFVCTWKNLTKHELVDNSDGHDSGRSAQLWLDVACKSPSLGLSFVFEPTTSSGPSTDARNDFIRATQAFATAVSKSRPAVGTKPSQPAISQQGQSDAQARYRQSLFEITSDPRFPGVERWKELLPLTDEFKRQLVGRKLVGNINKLYRWRLREDGKWSTKQVNDVMFDIVNKPGFNVDRALMAIASNRKP